LCERRKNTWRAESGMKLGFCENRVRKKGAGAILGCRVKKGEIEKERRKMREMGQGAGGGLCEKREKGGRKPGWSEKRRQRIREEEAWIM